MVRQPDATVQSTAQDHQLMSKHRVLGFKPQLRFEWRGQDGQNETEQPDHSANLGDSITSSTRTRFSVRTGSLRGVIVTWFYGSIGKPTVTALNVLRRYWFLRPQRQPRSRRAFDA